MKTTTQLFAALIALSPIVVSAADLDDVNVTALPNVFVNGQVADANDINDNFEYLRSNMATLVTALKEQQNPSTDPNRFSGSFKITGTEMQLDLCSETHPIEPQVNQVLITGSAMINAGMLSVDANYQRQSLLAAFSLTSTDGNISGVRSRSLLRTDSSSETLKLVVDAAGNISGGPVLGYMSADGNSFTLSAAGTSDDTTCNTRYLFALTGTRIQP